jgi:hypothetical protein
MEGYGTGTGTGLDAVLGSTEGPNLMEMEYRWSGREIWRRDLAEREGHDCSTAQPLALTLSRSTLQLDSLKVEAASEKGKLPFLGELPDWAWGEFAAKA